MKPLGWIILIGLIASLCAGFMIIANYSADRGVSVELKIIMALTSIVAGIVSGLGLFLPFLFLANVLVPNVPHNGHVAMPVAQAAIGALFSIISGLITVVITYRIILRCKKRKTLV